MMARILSMPLLVILLGIGAGAMYVPAIYAYVKDDLFVARVFLYGGTLFLMLTVFIGIATASGKSTNLVRSHLLGLLGAFTVLPVILAVPFYEGLRTTTFFNAYFEMVSSLTTTGATLFEPARLPEALHLWRAMVGWMGGFLIWVAAIAILARMNLGGFEVTAMHLKEQQNQTALQPDQMPDPPHQLGRHAAGLFPIYAGLTLILWIALLLAGDRPLVAVSHAMSTIATSGISPIGGLGQEGGSGLRGEAIIFVFLFFAISRLTFTADQQISGTRRLHNDPEFRMGVILVILLPVVLLLRHWLGALESNADSDFATAIRAFWGGMFTVLSFLTTTGFESLDWADARNWSGLQTPGLMLLGLSVIGGGVATTAGGVKLMRVYALYKHGARELERLIHPASVAGSGKKARFIRREGAQIAWIFLMLFSMSVAVVMLALSAAGLTFEQAMIFGVSALSTNGPLVSVAADVPLEYASLDGVAKSILLAAMVLGRLETLAIIALFNPSLWRS
ncbi:MAG TPA: TrkH family potassium uptake protein [Rhodobacteraceae bacterium]|nr:TrkH family potassium uptake protein [Paracoccaceae bacterium]